MKQKLAQAFYAGSQAHGLDGIPYLKYSDSIEQSLRVIERFATAMGVQLLIIIDQLHRKLSYFQEMTGSLISTLGGHRVIVSSSTSGTTEPGFLDFCIRVGV